MFKICAVSDVGTEQYGNESDPIIISAEGTLMNNNIILFIKLLLLKMTV